MKYQREILKNLQGYVPGEQPKFNNIVKLNTNESPYPPSPKVIEALRQLTGDSLRKYPDSFAYRLREACAARYGYPGADWVLPGNGMDELLAMAVRAFVDPGDTVLTTYPTYILYETLANLHGADCRFCDLDENFQLTEEFYKTPARLCFLPRPNSPTGVCPPREAVERLCREFNGIVLIDEAYVDFADDNCMDFPRKFENAIVMRTMSKSFSLAGARLGVAVANPEIIGEFIKIKDSYNVNAVTQAVGIAAMEDYEHMQAAVAKIRTTRARLTRALEDMGFRVPASQSNFVFAQWDGSPRARDIFRALRERAIIVRYFDQPRLANGMRISVGSDEEIDRLLNALSEILG
jgi:histidinol-phosphate aminotransferase